MVAELKQRVEQLQQQLAERNAALAASAATITSSSEGAAPIKQQQQQHAVASTVELAAAATRATAVLQDSVAALQQLIVELHVDGGAAAAAAAAAPLLPPTAATAAAPAAAAGSGMAGSSCSLEGSGAGCDGEDEEAVVDLNVSGHVMTTQMAVLRQVRCGSQSTTTSVIPAATTLPSITPSCMHATSCSLPRQTVSLLSPSFQHSAFPAPVLP
jgi:3-dehydroquinate dehydratase